MKFLPLLLAATVSVPLLAQPAQNGPALTLEQQTSLRCAAAFAIVADGQARGNAEALSLPPLQERGREFFVRFSARLMDETGMTREQVAALLSAEAQGLWNEGATQQVMPACLLLLDASGL